MRHAPARRANTGSIAAALVLGSACGAALAQPEVEQAQQRLEAARAALAEAEAALAAAQADVSAAETAEKDALDDAGLTPKQSLFDGWDGNFSAGVSGSTGNTEAFNARIAFRADRMTDRTETYYDATFIYETNDGEQTASRFDTGIRNDWLLEGPWRLFAQARYEFDDQQDWDHRISGSAGVGYEFINNDKTTLVGRAGLGGSQTIGGSEESFRPEGVLGIDLTHEVNDSMSLAAGSTYFPSLDPFGEFRLNSYGEMRIALAEESNMFVTAGVAHRHDSDPGEDTRNNDLDYYLTLGWDF
ncbi:MAG: DUF481 domain-containing protein [Planctomycetota bacterium]